MDIEKLKAHPLYHFEIAASEEVINQAVNFSHGDFIDDWDIAYLSVGEYGCEYNLYLDFEQHVENASAIYMTNVDCDGYWVTDSDVYEQYCIDFTNPNWAKDLENAMCKFFINQMR